MAHPLKFSGRQSAWLLSPMAVTIVFIFLRMVLGWNEPTTVSSVEGASADSPRQNKTLQVQVVARIQAVEQADLRIRSVPNNEAALFELIQRDGSVTFGADEVDIVSTAAREFETEEVDVITVRR